MTSKISYFDAAIFRRSVRKTLPLWICYLVFWLFILPGGLISFEYNPKYYGSITGSLCALILNYCSMGAAVSALIGLLAAWLLFSWLFHTNTAYFYAALPVRREALFVTNFSVGLVMVTAANLVTALSAFLVTLSHGYPQLYACACFFGVSMLEFLGFYGFAVFLAMIIGQTAVMPAVYVILNFTSTILYYAVRYLLVNFVYGMSDRWNNLSVSIFEKLSPVAYMLTHLTNIPVQLADGTYDESRYLFGDWGYVAILAAAGIVFTVLALLIFRRREMERSGDVIAVKCLRPVFLCCFTLGCAIVLSYVLTAMQSGTLYGPAAFRQTLLFLVLGAFFGYFLAQMLLKKSLAVFRGAKTWVGLGAVCLVLVLGCTAARLDIFGTYSHVPDAEDISSIYLTYGGTTYDVSVFEEVTQFQRLAIERQQENEAAANDSWTFADFNYYLKDGSFRPFRYHLASGEAERNDADSLVRRFDAILNSESIVLSRNAIPEEFSRDASAFAYCSIEVYNVSDEQGASLPRYLSSEDAFTFYTTCVLPDLKDTELGRDHIILEAETKDTVSSSIRVGFHIDPTNEQVDQYTKNKFSDGPSSYSMYYDFTITKDAWRSAAYLENLGFSFNGPLG